MPSSRIPVALSLGLALASGGCGKGADPPPVEPVSYMGPEITLEAPARGAMLMEGGTGLGPVAIRGQACDPVHALASLQIGTEALVPAGGAACQPFQLQVPSRWGLSIVHGEATNDAGEKGYLAQSFIRSPSYFSAASGDPASRAESGILLQLNPQFVDDGDRGTPNDIASIVQLALGGLDLDAAVGAVRFAQPDADGDGQIDLISHDCIFWTEWNKRTGFEAWKNGPVTHAGITVDRLALEDGGISARITVWGPRVPFGVLGNLDSGCLGDAQDTVFGDARATALALEGRAAVGFDAQGRPQAEFSSLSATLSGLELDIALGPLVDWTGLGNLIGDAIAAQVQGPIQDAIRGGVRGTLNGRLASVLAALSAFQQSIALPPALGSTELVIESAIDQLDFTKRRAVIGSSIHVRPVAPRPEHLAAAPFGAMRTGGARPDGSAFAGASVVLGVADDALNQILHAAWLGGAFDLSDISGLAGLGGLPGGRLALFSHLPPLVMPREAGAHGVDLGWGDLAFDLSFTSPQGDARVTGFLSLVLPVERLEVAPGGRSFGPVFGPEVQAHVQITQVNWGHRPTARKMFTELLQGAARNVLPGLLAEATRSVPLPDWNLAAVDSSLPSLVLSLQDPQMARLENYHLVAGSVAAQP